MYSKHSLGVAQCLQKKKKKKKKEKKEEETNAQFCLLADNLP